MDIFAPIQLFADVVTFRWLGVAKESYLGSSLNFFLYDSIKIGLLLVLINFVMAVTRYYFPMETVRDILVKRRWYGFDYLLAALLGVVTPFCSCSSIPLFMGFVAAGIPLGVTFTFLISSPLVNESSLSLFPVLFGAKVTLLYNLSGILISIAGGLFISRLRVKQYVKPEILQLASRKQQAFRKEKTRHSFLQLIQYWWHDGMSITRRVFPYVLLGVAIGAIIHGFVPAGLVEQYLTPRTWYAIPLATLLGAPLYANSVSVIPVMEALVEKGVPLGTALAFLTAVVTVSLPESMMLLKVMHWKLLALFLAITLTGVMLMGYIFNAIL